MTAGEITNLTSIDAQRLQDITTYFHAIWYMDSIYTLVRDDGCLLSRGGMFRDLVRAAALENRLWRCRSWILYTTLLLCQYYSQHVEFAIPYLLPLL
jgi:hypothetical protein